MRQTPNQQRKKQLPWLAVIAVHIAAVGLALLVYAFFHHVMPHSEQAIGITSDRNAVVAEATALVTPSPTPAPEAVTVVSAEATPTVEPTPTPAPTDSVGSFRIKFADKFTDGEIVYDDTTYQSANIYATVQTIEFLGASCNIADFYIADITCLATEFANNHFGKSYAEWPRHCAKRTGAVLTINGDYYGAHDNGIVVHNGTLYRNEKNSCDVCAIYWDGTMKTFDPDDFDAETEMENGAYQVWCFGPNLLTADGGATSGFNSRVCGENPRTAIGYFEPGHYCFVTVDGRSDQSDGLKMSELSELMASLGCKVAYNLDGGQSSTMVRATTIVGNPSGGGRKVSDFVVVVEPDEEAVS